MKEIYFVRHGQTDYNKNNIVQGATINAPLNSIGSLQGKAFFEHYKKIKFDHIYISALKRTKETIQSFIDLEIPYTSHTELNELNFGIYDGKKHTKEDTPFNQLIDKWHQGETHLRPESGESPEDLANKQKEFIKKIKNDQFQKALVCMHGRAMRILLSQLLDQPLHQMNQFQHHNTCLYLINYDGEKFSLAKRNDLTHLEVFETTEQLVFS